VAQPLVRHSPPDLQFRSRDPRATPRPFSTEPKRHFLLALRPIKSALCTQSIPVPRVFVRLHVPSPLRKRHPFRKPRMQCADSRFVKRIQPARVICSCSRGHRECREASAWKSRASSKRLLGSVVSLLAARDGGARGEIHHRVGAIPRAIQNLSIHEYDDEIDDARLYSEIHKSRMTEDIREFVRIK